jgi:hypothetical protein
MFRKRKKPVDWSDWPAWLEGMLAAGAGFTGVYTAPNLYRDDKTHVRLPTDQEWDTWLAEISSDPLK